GNVLVTGGVGDADFLASCELYDPSTAKWKNITSMTEERSSHTTTMLKSGKILATAGYGYTGYLDSSEIYDPSTGKWTPSAKLSTTRASHTATMFNSGKVLITGGEKQGSVRVDNEITTPADVPIIKFDPIRANSTSPHELYTIFHQAYEQLHNRAHELFRRNDNRVWIAQYLEMHSIDPGGPYRDSIPSVCADMYSTRLPLFILRPNGRRNSGLNYDRWVSNVFPSNKAIPNRIKRYYHFIEQLMDMAIRKKHYLDLKFSGPFWKQLV
ncbi:unnamed protein product, partial [Rotaria sordida]